MAKTNKFPKNRQELLAELIDLGERTMITDDKIVFLSLAYLLNELVPKDRTTDRVLKNLSKEV
jgi:hypothetical protein